MNTILEEVKKYYSNITNNEEGQMASKICTCAKDSAPKHIKAILPLINEEILNRFYGCGSPIPPVLEGLTVLDLGCGTGRDCYILSKLVGEKGRVIGVDMNADQLAIAKKHQHEMAIKYGYTSSNITFLQGYIEDLKALGLENESVDVVVSNCVINLSPNKKMVFEEIWRVLKCGGELYFSDIFADRRIPEAISQNPILRGECLGGAMYIEDFRRLMQSIGWLDFRYMYTQTACIDNPEIESLIGNANFTSRTIRAMKLPNHIEDICEEYGQVVIYRGGIEHQEFAFDLDDHHKFIKGLSHKVCGNTCAMLQNTRFAPYFDVFGDRTTHFGAFEGCSKAPTPSDNACTGGSCCC